MTTIPNTTPAPRRPPFRVCREGFSMTWTRSVIWPALYDSRIGCAEGKPLTSRGGRSDVSLLDFRCGSCAEVRVA